MTYMKRINLYPFFLAVWPVLALYATNSSQVSAWVIIRPFILSLVFSTCFYAACLRVTHNSHKAALLTGFLTLLFFSYGHFYQFLSISTILGHNFAHHRVLIPIYFVFLIMGIWWISAKIKDYALYTHIMIGISIALVASSVVQIIVSFTKGTNASASLVERTPADLGLKPNPEIFQIASPAGRDKPDIYYIILDMYTRSDALKEDFLYDDQPFLEELQHLGFYIAACSRSNYAETRLSLASSLNMNYLEALGEKFTPDNPDKSPLVYLIRHSQVMKQYQAIGYRTIAFQTGFPFSELTNADLYIAPPSEPLLLREIQPFEDLFLQSTALRIAAEVGPQPVKNSIDWITFPYYDHARRLQYNLEKLAEIPEIPGPKFVFAHLISPHFPFIFTPDGSFLQDTRYYNQPGDHPAEEFFVDGYRDQVAFINNRILAVIKEILANSTTPPIIIIQGDHGVRDLNRLKILNAYLFPGGSPQLYPRISPVNTFRVIDNVVFGANYPLLEDISRQSDYVYPYRFETMPEDSSQCKSQ